MKKLVIGLTGPVASGKNEVCKMLRKKGAYIIDADQIGHEIIKKGTKAWGRIVMVFGRGVLNSDRSIDRKKLGEIVFGNKKRLKKLDSITHPQIFSAVKKKISSSKNKHIVVNAAVLKEIGLLPVADVVVAVLSDKQLRIKRLMRSRKMTKQQALSRINSQMSDKDYKKIADHVVTNNSTISHLRGEIDKIYNKISDLD